MILTRCDLKEEFKDIELIDAELAHFRNYNGLLNRYFQGIASDVVWAKFGDEEWNKKLLYPTLPKEGIVNKRFSFEDRNIEFYWPEKEEKDSAEKV